MHRVACRAVVVAALLVVGPGARAATGGEQAPPATQPGRRDISALLDAQRVRHRLPALAAAVVDGNGVIAAGVAGVRKAGEPAPVTITDRWHLGSCTKAMTATLIATLVEQQKLSWDLTIAQALPDLAEEMRPEYRDVTIEMLLANRGGIALEGEVPGLWAKLWRREGTPVEQRRTMARAMLGHEPRVPVGTYRYANCGFAIAGHMAETVTGTPWEGLMREHLFRPLGMHSAGFGIDWSDLSQPWPHDDSGAAVEPSPLADNPPAIGPAGTVHASLDDWARLVIDHLKGARGEAGTLLRPGSYARLHRGRPIDHTDHACALGWLVHQRPWAKGARPDDTGRCLHHAGSNTTWFALVWIAPERNFAVLCVTNIGGDGVFPRIDAALGAVLADHMARETKP